MTRLNRWYPVTILSTVGILAVLVAVFAVVDRTTGEQRVDPLQAQALADGQVDHDEYARAVEAARDCVAGAGIAVGPLRDVAGRIDFEYGGADTLEAAREQGEVYAGCFRTHAQEVTETWLQQRAAASGDATVHRQGIIRCLQEAGVEVAGDASSVDLAAVAERSGITFWQCARPFADERGLIEF